MLHSIHPLITLYKYELFPQDSAVMPGLMVQTCHRVVKAGECESEASLDFRERFCLQKKGVGKSRGGC